MKADQQSPGRTAALPAVTRSAPVPASGRRFPCICALTATLLAGLGAVASPAAGAEEAVPPSLIPRALRALSMFEGVIRDAKRELEEEGEILRILGEMTPFGERPGIASARAAVEAAEKEYEAAHEAAGLGELRERLRAAQKARDDAVERLLADAPAFRAARKEHEALERRIEGLALKIKMPKQSYLGVFGLAKLRLEARRLGRTLNAARRATWRRAEVEPLYRKADALYKSHGRKVKGGSELARASEKSADARRRLKEAFLSGAATDGPHKLVLLVRAGGEEMQAAFEARLAREKRKIIGDVLWHHEVPVELPPKRGKPRGPSKACLWIPPRCERVRGLVVGHPPILGGKLTEDFYVRTVAAEKGLAVILLKDLDAVFDYADETKKSPERLVKALADLAGASGRPEIEHAPMLTIGHSTSGIFARNVAYWRPERVIGVIHIKSGNMHHHRPDPTRTLAGVPFIAINGEYEEYGPEGGIRGEYGRQTQWVMIREQMLRRRAKDPAHLMSLVVHPGGSHTDWSGELSRLCAMFIRKAVERRVPEGKADPPAGGEGDGPVRCVPLDPDTGWLTDADIKDPKHEPAPWGEYAVAPPRGGDPPRAGERARAFWHLDEEIARAVRRYHEGRFLLPDPTRESPVPADWPPKR